ncbi:uncharacterized protein LOC110843229 [Folsomia candida]|nr:uncharacterized protein LOC110843229 [Folsomia candida]
MRAIVFGGTGAVGTAIIRALDDAKAYTHATLVVRRRLQLELLNPSKFETHIINFERIQDFRHVIEQRFDTAFYAIGVSSRKVDAKYYHQVEVELSSEILDMLSNGGTTPSVHLISCMFVHKNSWLIHKRMKYETEEYLEKKGFDCTFIYKMGGVIAPGYRGMMHPVQQRFAKYFDFWRLLNIDADVVGRAVVVNSLLPRRKGNYELCHSEIKMLGNNV